MLYYRENVIFYLEIKASEQLRGKPIAYKLLQEKEKPPAYLDKVQVKQNFSLYPSLFVSRALI